jgi:hypothetical protein
MQRNGFKELLKRREERDRILYKEYSGRSGGSDAEVKEPYK